MKKREKGDRESEREKVRQRKRGRRKVEDGEKKGGACISISH